MTTIDTWSNLVNDVKTKISTHRKGFLISREDLFAKATAQV